MIIELLGFGLWTVASVVTGILIERKNSAKINPVITSVVADVKKV